MLGALGREAEACGASSDDDGSLEMDSWWGASVRGGAVGSMSLVTLLAVMAGLCPGASEDL